MAVRTRKSVGRQYLRGLLESRVPIKLLYTYQVQAVRKELAVCATRWECHHTGRNKNLPRSLRCQPPPSRASLATLRVLNSLNSRVHNTLKPIFYGRRIITQQWLKEKTWARSRPLVKKALITSPSQSWQWVVPSERLSAYLHRRYFRL